MADVRLELENDLFSVNDLNNVAITEESGQSFLNIKLAIPTSTSSAATEEETTRFRDVTLGEELLKGAGRSASRIDFEKFNSGTNEGTSLFTVTLQVVTKVPHTGDG